MSHGESHSHQDNHGHGASHGHGHKSGGGSLKGFFKQPLQMGATKAPEKNNPLTAVDGVINNVAAVMKATANYVTDILSPAYEGVKSLATMPLIFGKNGWKSLPKGFANFCINELAAVKNATLGLAGGASIAYKKGVQDSVLDVTSGTVDRVSMVGPFIGNMIKIIPSTIGLVPDMINWALKKVDSGFEYLDHATALKDRHPAKVRLAH